MTAAARSHTAPVHSRLVQSAVGTYTQLTDGQRWTIALIGALVGLFVGFGLRNGAPVSLAAARPAPAAPIGSDSAPPAPTKPDRQPHSTTTPVLGTPPRPGPAAHPKVRTSPPATHAVPPPQLRPLHLPSVFARITRPATTGGIAAGAHGRVYVVTTEARRARLEVLSRAGSRLRRITITAVRPQDLGPIAFNSRTRDVYALRTDPAAIIRINPRTGAQRTVATIPDLPPCLLALGDGGCEPGLVNHAPQPEGIAVDRGGSLYVADAGQGTVWRMAPGGRSMRPWYQSLDFATGQGPGAVTATRRGVLVAVGLSTDLANFDKGGLYAIGVSANGAAGPRRLVASLPRAAAPRQLVRTRGGVVLMMLHDGAIERLRGSALRPFDLARSPVPIALPAGLSPYGRDVLVATGGAPRRRARWAVVRFPVR